MKKQCKYFIIEIEALKKELKEMKNGKTKNKKQTIKKAERSLVKSIDLSKKKEIFLLQN